MFQPVTTNANPFGDYLQ